MLILIQNQNIFCYLHTLKQVKLKIPSKILQLWLSCSACVRPASLNAGQSTADKLTDTIDKWIARDCRLINMVEKTDFAGFLKTTLSARPDALHSD